MLDTEEYSYLWDSTSSSDWGLFKVSDNDLHYVIFNVSTRSALVIESDELSAQIVKKMLDNNCKVFSDWNELSAL